MSDHTQPSRAFPVAGPTGVWSHGMTLRDYFAAKAVQSIIQTEETQAWNNPDAVVLDAAGMAEAAYICADAMLAARENPND